MSVRDGIKGLYIHVPFCDGKCAYCAFYSVPYTGDQAADWLAAIGTEARLLASRYGRIRPETLYFGGGTPTQLGAHGLFELIEVLLRELIVPGWKADERVEWTVEANPGSVTEDLLRGLRSAGVNRVSLGVQVLDDDVLTMLGRRHRVADVEASVRAIQASGFGNWGVDLIACVPGVGDGQWIQMLRRVVGWEPRHVSVYALTPEEGTALKGEILQGRQQLTDEDDQLRALAVAETELEGAGFSRYEISNYSKPGYECRHNLAVWRGENYLGLGCAAASRVGHSRWANAADIGGYIRKALAGEWPDREDDSLSSDKDALERLVFGLRMAAGVNLEVLREATGCGEASTRRWQDLLTGLATDGLVVGHGGWWRLTGRGREVADYVAVELMP